MVLDALGAASYGRPLRDGTSTYRVASGQSPVGSRGCSSLTPPTPPKPFSVETRPCQSLLHPVHGSHCCRHPRAACTAQAQPSPVLAILPNRCHFLGEPGPLHPSLPGARPCALIGMGSSQAPAQLLGSPQACPAPLQPPSAPGTGGSGVYICISVRCPVLPVGGRDPEARRASFSFTKQDTDGASGFVAGGVQAVVGASRWEGVTPFPWGCLCCGSYSDDLCGARDPDHTAGLCGDLPELGRLEQHILSPPSASCHPHLRAPGGGPFPESECASFSSLDFQTF